MYTFEIKYEEFGFERRRIWWSSNQFNWDWNNKCHIYWGKNHWNPSKYYLKCDRHYDDSDDDVDYDDAVKWTFNRIHKNCKRYFLSEMNNLCLTWAFAIVWERAQFYEFWCCISCTSLFMLTFHIFQMFCIQTMQ